MGGNAQMTNLSDYIHKFSHLRVDRTGGWDDRTRGRAPHKPLVLLCVLDLAAQGTLTSNLIEVGPELLALFSTYWKKIFGQERKGNMALPFFHLRSSKFWHLLPKPGQEAALAAVRQVDTLGQLNRFVLGARLDEDLFHLIQISEPREALRKTLVDTCFSPEIQPDLIALGATNLKAYLYGQELIAHALQNLRETPQPDENYVRDQGFRKAVVRVYEHRCAFCGVRMLTVEGHTAVDAAHIIPWHISHNDDIHNGMALCQLCHWTFDEGLMGVSDRYQVLLSGELRSALNVPGHLLTLVQREILGPAERTLWPDREALDYHRAKVYRG